MGKASASAATHSGSGSRSRIMQPVIGGKTSALEGERRERPRSAAASHGTHGWHTITAGGADVWCRPAALMLLQSHTKWVLIYISCSRCHALPQLTTILLETCRRALARSLRCVSSTSRCSVRAGSASLLSNAAQGQAKPCRNQGWSDIRMSATVECVAGHPQLQAARVGHAWVRWQREAPA